MHKYNSFDLRDFWYNRNVKNTLIENFVGTKLNSSQSKKVQILEASLEILATQGQRYFTLTNLQTKTGVSKALIRYHYPELDSISHELLQILAGLGQSYVLEASEGLSSPEDLIMAQVTAAFRWAIQNQQWSKFFIYIYHQATYKKETAFLHQMIVEKGLQRMLSNVEKLKIPTESQESLAWACQNLLIGSIIKMASVNDFDNADKYFQSCAFSISQLLNFSDISIPKL